MSTVVKDLGAVSAYAYAVEKGYTGTEAEFAELMADYAEVGQRAEDAAESALNSKTAAQTAATTATTKASEAATSAQTATTKAGEAQTSAQTASSKASEASQSASQASGYAQTAETAKTDAQTAKTQADTARNEAVTAKIAAETAQGKAETAQGAAEDAAQSVSASAAQIATNTADITDLKEGLGAITEDENLKSTGTVYTRVITTSGVVQSNSNYKTIVLPCMPNMAYKIINPYGGILRCGASNDSSYSQTLPAYKADYTETSGVYTVGNYNYLFVNFYNASAATDTLENVIAALKITVVSADDKLLRRTYKADAIYVAAFDSEDKYKRCADFVCTGTNDEVTLQQALEAVGQNGTLYLGVGTYNIDAFNSPSDGGQPYVLKYDSAKYNRVKICGYNQTPTRTAVNAIGNVPIINITGSCYSALDANTIYTIIRGGANNGARKYRYNTINVEGIGFKLPDNQKKIIAIDGYFASAMIIKNCMFNALASNDDAASVLSVGSEDCIGIRGTQTSNFGIGNRIESCFVSGFGIGFSVSGEHFVYIDCLARYCKYGFIFDYFDNSAHPNTLINCSDEFNFNFPLFGSNAGKLPLTMIDFNLEWRSDYFALGGDYAEEVTPGDWRGNINYSIKGYSFDSRSGNQVDIPFWANGHGINVASKNDAQKAICTTTERTAYAPNPMQRVYDTTLNKFFTYVNGEWIEA